jgi:hypothetical protein
MAGPLSSYPLRSGDQPDSLKLPAIRSLTDLSSPSSSSATSPATRPLPWPLHEDTGSKGGPSSLSSSSSRFASGTPSSSSSSSAQSAQNIAQLPRPLLQRPVSTPTPGRPPTSTSQPHPFFDRGRKSSLYVSPPPEPGMQSRDDREALAAREQPDDALSEVSLKRCDRFRCNDTRASELATDCLSHSHRHSASNRLRTHYVWLSV